MPSPALAALLFCSGLAALVYETLWVRQTTLVIGVDVYAVTTVVSAFFAGLGVGSMVLGAWADRTARPLALLATLSAGAAVLGAATTLALGGLAPLYVGLGSIGWGLPFALVALPAVPMGGMLPAAVRVAGPGAGHVATVAGTFYAINTAGGIAGALLAVFLLVPALGVRRSGLAAATVSLGVAAVAAAYARRPAPVHAPGAASASASPPRLALALYALAGAVALGYEVVWTQVIVPFVGTRAHAFAIVLATYLAGLVLGAAASARAADRSRRPWTLFALLELGAGAVTLALFAALGPWLPRAQSELATIVLAWTGSAAAALGARLALPPLALVLLPALLLGATFPAAARLACGPSHVGRDVGTVTAVNTLGGIAGTCLTGFVAIPLLGLRGTLALLAGVAAGVGGAALVRGAGRPRLAGVGAALAVAAVAAAGYAIPRDHLARVFVATRGGALVAHEESAGGTVAVVAEPFREASFHRLYIQGVSNSHDGLMSRRYMRLQALLPLLIHDGDSRAAMVVGLGTGITCGALLAYPGLERRVCVELLPAVVRSVRHFSGNYDVADDARVEIRIADGRHDLLLRPDRYDVITLEPPPPVAAGAVNLYSRDFYTLCRRRLAPRGLMAQWLPLATQNDADTRSLVRSFLDVFPHADLWSTELHEMLLVGAEEPIVLDPGRIAERLAQPSVAGALAEVGIADAASLLATYVTDRAGLERYAGDAPPVTDDRPRIEHAGSLVPGEFARTLAHVLQSRREPPLVGGDDALRASVAAHRDRLIDFYQAAVYWYGGRADEMEPLLERVLSEEPSNPYFRWFVGG